MTPADEDAEIRALSITFSLVKSLDESGRRRLLAYLAERLSVSPAPVLSADPPRAPDLSKDSV
ncbi:MAG: hypothetical protein ACREWE_16715, partial [Gammaproteobacteria bacterium]